MKYPTWRVLAAVLALLGSLTSTHAQQREEKRSTDNFRLIKIQQYQLLLAADKPPCDTETQAFCPIEVQVITVDGRDYCLAIAPDLRVKKRVIGKKTLVWKLNVPNLRGKPVAFHGKSGIVVTVDLDEQIDAGGGHGNGSSPSPAPTEMYFVKTKAKKLGAVSSYLPVVLWGSGGGEELCAAIDPRIVNVN